MPHSLSTKDQYEGSPLWLETQNVQADAKGNYTVQLGATKAEGLPLDLVTSGEARWLGVTINGGQEQPRVLLLSVPYAVEAKSGLKVQLQQGQLQKRSGSAPGIMTSTWRRGAF